jgi:hypothetical protein
MHNFVRSTWNILVVGTPWENFLETTLLPGMGVGYLGMNLGKQTRTSWVPVTTRVLCVTQSLGATTSKSTRQWKNNSARIRLAAQRSKPVKKIKWAAQRPQPRCLMLIKLDSSLGRSHFVPDGVDQCHVGFLQPGGQLRPACCSVAPVKITWERVFDAKKI